MGKKIETAQLNGYIKGRYYHFPYATECLFLSRIKCSSSIYNRISSGEKHTVGRGCAYQPQLKLWEGKAPTKVENNSSRGGYRKYHCIYISWQIIHCRSSFSKDKRQYVGE